MGKTNKGAIVIIYAIHHFLNTEVVIIEKKRKKYTQKIFKKTLRKHKPNLDPGPVQVVEVEV
jgi:hypothetical protein